MYWDGLYNVLSKWPTVMSIFNFHLLAFTRIIPPRSATLMRMAYRGVLMVDQKGSSRGFLNAGNFSDTKQLILLFGGINFYHSEQ
jgi:histidinol phosphatase-like enzyme